MDRIKSIPFDFIRAALRRGWHPDIPDFRDLFADNLLTLARGGLPGSVDLSGDCSAVEDQLTLGSCTAQMLAGIMEYLLKRDGRFVDVSRLALYYAEREAMGTVGQDSGASIRGAFRALAQTGAAREDLWPYLVDKFAVRPDDAVYADALTRRLAEYRRISPVLRLRQCKAALAQRLPFGFGVTVYSSMMTAAVAKTGLVPMPTRSDNLEGGHAVMGVGYDDAAGLLKFRNSWGEAWGDDGYGYLPYDYISDPMLSSDFWAGYRESEP
jgi:C1A family cysteine protease